MRGCKLQQLRTRKPRSIEKNERKLNFINVQLKREAIEKAEENSEDEKNERKLSFISMQLKRFR